MSDLKHARHLLMMANKDLAALAGMSDPAVFADEIFGFHAQQAAEKALKAWLAALGVVYPLKHDLALLLHLLAKHGADVSAFKSLDDYTDFAVDFRYLGIEMAADYTLAPSEHVADVVLLNTCSVRNNAEQKAINKVENLVGTAKKERRDHLLHRDARSSHANAFLSPAPAVSKGGLETSVVYPFRTWNISIFGDPSHGILPVLGSVGCSGGRLVELRKAERNSQ